MSSDMKASATAQAASELSGKPGPSCFPVSEAYRMQAGLFDSFPRQLLT
jgi:hypothetical protein